MAKQIIEPPWFPRMMLGMFGFKAYSDGKRAVLIRIPTSNKWVSKVQDKIIAKLETQLKKEFKKEEDRYV